MPLIPSKKHQLIFSAGQSTRSSMDTRIHNDKDWLCAAVKAVSLWWPRSDGWGLDCGEHLLTSIIDIATFEREWIGKIKSVLIHFI